VIYSGRRHDHDLIGSSEEADQYRLRRRFSARMRESGPKAYCAWAQCGKHPASKRRLLLAPVEVIAASISPIPTDSDDLPSSM